MGNLEREPVKSSTQDQWFITRDIARNLGVSNYKVKSVLEGLPFRVGKNKARRVSRFYNQDQVASLLGSYLNAPPPDDGWMTNNSLAIELERDFSSVKRTANKFREEHPDWFQKRKKFVGISKRIIEVYSPELVSEITARLKPLPEAPDGWENVDNIEKLLSTTFEVINKLADSYRETHPEWFAQYSGRKNRRVDEYFSPDLIQELTKQVKERKDYPRPSEGWKTISSLTAEFKKEGIRDTREIIERLVSEHQKDHPEWVVDYLINHPTNKRIFPHLSPELIALIRNQMIEFAKPPEGWQTAYGLSRSLRSKVSREKDFRNSIKTIIKKLEREHPEWFNWSPGRGGMLKYFSPQAVAEIKRTLDESPSKKPKGYWTPERIETEVREFLKKHGDISPSVIKKNYPELLNIISYYPGGAFALRQKFNIPLVVKPKNYWADEKIEEEAREFLSRFGILSQAALRKKGRDDLVYAISRKYPGGMNALKEKLRAQKGISSEKANRYIKSLVS